MCPPRRDVEGEQLAAGADDERRAVGREREIVHGVADRHEAGPSAGTIGRETDVEPAHRVVGRVQDRERAALAEDDAATAALR